jgi:hypothetical protein
MMQAFGAYGYLAAVKGKRKLSGQCALCDRQSRNSRAKTVDHQRTAGLARHLYQFDQRPEAARTKNRGLTRDVFTDCRPQKSFAQIAHLQFWLPSIGIPADNAGHGGGYVFDCRGLPNPGRYPIYAQKNGSDAEVIDFLQNDPVTGEFLLGVLTMVRLHAQNYVSRGLTDLMVCFGCTGGQHRSVIAPNSSRGNCGETVIPSTSSISINHYFNTLMKAIILAAGYGTRLKPLTDYLPKALVRIAGKPLLQIAIERLLCAGISDIGINVHHFSEQIIEFLHKHRFFGAEITLSPENKILGTGGGAKRLIRRMGEDEAFLIINVDVLTDLDFAQFSAAFVRENPMRCWRSNTAQHSAIC